MIVSIEIFVSVPVHQYMRKYNNLLISLEIYPISSTSAFYNDINIRMIVFFIIVVIVGGRLQMNTFIHAIVVQETSG